jgi:methionyl aminopeptidase
MTLAIEPMIIAGGSKTKLLSNGWTVVAADGSLAAHSEHTVAVTDSEAVILTA